MIPRRPASPLSLLLALPLALPIVLSLAGCNSLHSIAILPAAGSVVLTGVGQTAQFTAFGSSQMGSGQPTTTNLTTSVTWAASNPSVATINSSGIATATGSGYTQITAESDGVIATSDVTVTISTGSGNGGTPSIIVSPTSTAETFTGETTQFTATGNLTGVGGVQNLTNQVEWVSSSVQVATVNASGLATAVGSGTTTITAQSGGLSATATLTVALGATTPATPTLTIIPGSVTDSGGGVITQFVAIGNLTGNGPVQNLTSVVTWVSSDVQDVTITSSGLATSVFNPPFGTSYSPTITAIGTTTSGSVLTASVNVTVLSTTTTAPVAPTPTLSVYELGTGTGNVSTSNGSAPFINCGLAGGTVCGQTFPQGSIVTLTATPAPGSVFGGWSSNCAAASANSCTITMSANQTVGATFNP
jgi:trimeric autotransporter adhesin